MKCARCNGYSWQEEDAHEAEIVCINGHRYPVTVREPLPILRGPCREQSKLRRRLRPRHAQQDHDAETCATCQEGEEWI